MSGARLDRRSVMKLAGAGTLAALSTPLPRGLAAKSATSGDHIKQSVCRWCYKDIPLEKLAGESPLFFIFLDKIPCLRIKSPVRKKEAGILCFFKTFKIVSPPSA